jgi:type I restriction enzyme R subunit
MDKRQLSERDICTKFIILAIQQAGWQRHQFCEKVGLTDGRVMVRGKLAARIRNPAEMLDAPFVISSNGDGFLIHDRAAEVAE